MVLYVAAMCNPLCGRFKWSHRDTCAVYPCGRGYKHNCILAYITGTQAFHVTTIEAFVIEGSIVMDRSFHCDVAQLK